MLQENEDRLAKAIHIDIGKPRLEATVAGMFESLVYIDII